MSVQPAAPQSATASYRTILRSSSIMGVSSALNVVSGVLRMKVAALLLGPAGVGLIGMYQNLIQTAATAASLGIGTAGTRQIAAMHGDGDMSAAELARRALFWGTLALTALGGAVFALLSDWTATHVLHDPSRATDMRWLALGVALTVAAGSQSGLLIGLHRIGDLARIQIGSAAIATILGIAALSVWGQGGLLIMVLSAPVATFVQGLWFTRQARSPALVAVPWPQLTTQIRTLVRLGAAFMLSGLVTTLGQLAVRNIVQRDLGADALGQFQAAWSIGMLYLGFVLGAMATDYYPRLAATVGESGAAIRLINEQTEVALLLCGPVLLALLGMAPWVIELLYSPAFAPAADILRWQLLGDVLKVMSWPLGFVLLAAGAGKTFILAESLGVGVFVGVTVLAVKLLGPSATGWAFLAMYLCYLPVVYALARARIGFRWNRAVWRQGLVLFLIAIATAALGLLDTTLSAVAGTVSACAFGLYAVRRLAQRTEAGMDDRLGRKACLRESVQWISRTLGSKS
jgi:PST family polysaccharide transporter